jgi:hypothetical protein
MSIVAEVGIFGARFRNENRASFNPRWNTHDEGKPIHLNRANYSRTTGSCIGVQIGPNQTVANSNDIIGAEIRARSAAVATGALIAVKGEPNAANGTGTVGALRSFEANITAKGTRTVTNDISALRAFLDVDSEVTVTGRKSVILVAQPNVSGWDYLLELGASPGFLSGDDTLDTPKETIKIRINGADRFIQLYST